MNRLLLAKPFLLARRFISLLAAAFFLTVLPAYSQRAQLDALAARSAQALEKAHVKSVVVADFWDSNKELTKLGIVLADQFSAELSGAGGKFQALERGRLGKSLDDSGLSHVLLDDSDVAQWVAKHVGAKAIVLGEIAREGNEFHLTVTTLQASNGKNLGNFGVTLWGAPDWTSLMASPLMEEDVSRPVEAGKNGYTIPSCLYCPTPPFSDDAFEHKTQGIIVLDGVITAGGEATDIRVKKGLPHGLTVAAIKGVEKWRFKPAIGPDGKPAAVHLLIEVRFDIY
jgi:hypothetical protein